MIFFFRIYTFRHTIYHIFVPIKKNPPTINCRHIYQTNLFARKRKYKYTNYKQWELNEWLHIIQIDTCYVIAVMQTKTHTHEHTHTPKAIGDIVLISVIVGNFFFFLFLCKCEIYQIYSIIFLSNSIHLLDTWR